MSTPEVDKEPEFHNYLVQWSIDIEATSPEAAAERAREIQLDPDSIATIFEVYNDPREIEGNPVIVNLGHD